MLPRYCTSLMLLSSGHKLLKHQYPQPHSNLALSATRI